MNNLEVRINDKVSDKGRDKDSERYEFSMVNSISLVFNYVFFCICVHFLEQKK